MAEFLAFTAYDMSKFQISSLFAKITQYQFHDNLYFDGRYRVYEDAVYYSSKDNDAYAGAVGYNINYSNPQSPSGVVEAFEAREKVGDAFESFSMSRFAADINAILAVTKTTSTDDDMALLKSILASHDRITGSNKDDVLMGFDGNDYLRDGAGNDTIAGGNGNDLFEIGSGTNHVDGGAGHDVIRTPNEQNKYTLSLSKNATVLTDRTGADLVNYLTDIETISFDYDPFSLTAIEDVVDLSAAQLEGFVELYIAYFNRAPDAVGLYFWGSQLANGLSTTAIADLFFAQPETKALYPNPDDHSAFIDAVYANLFNRAPDAAGKAFWEGQLQNGSVKPGAFILEVIKGAKSPTGSASDVEFLANKTDLGVYYACIKGMNNIQDAKDVMGLYDGTTTGLNAARAAADLHYADAISTAEPEFLVKLVGVIDEPQFSTAPDVVT